jgi:hypothetical protein
MVETIEMQEIRGMDVDKVVKGFALSTYIFKNEVSQSSMSGDSVRWYQETAADLTATAPSKISNISPLSSFATLEPSWTRNTSYPKKYGVESFLSMEDIKSADIDVLARTLLRLTRAISKQVDADIWNVITENQSASNIQTFATTAVGGDQWDAANAAANPIKDLLHAKKLIDDYNYSTEDLTAFMSPQDYENVLSWIFAKGAQAPNVSDSIAKGGRITEIAGIKIKVSVNVTADYCLVANAKVAATWKSYNELTSRVIEEVGIGSKVRVWEAGICILTDPKACVLITDTQS